MFAGSPIHRVIGQIRCVDPQGGETGTVSPGICYWTVAFAQQSGWLLTDFEKSPDYRKLP